MTKDVYALLKATPLVVRRGPFALGSWAPAQVSAVYAGLLRAHGELAFAVLDDKEATALVVETHLFELPPPHRLERGWSVLTLDQTMAWDLVGVLARVTTALAGAGLPVGAITAFQRDHLLVKYEKLERALEALSGVCGDVRIID